MTKRYEYQGSEFTLKQLAELSEVNETCLRTRLEMGWPIDKAMTTPSKKHAFEYKGVKCTLRDIAKQVDIPYGTLNRRIKVMGMTLQQALEYRSH